MRAVLLGALWIAISVPIAALVAIAIRRAASADLSEQIDRYLRAHTVRRRPARRQGARIGAASTLVLAAMAGALSLVSDVPGRIVAAGLDQRSRPGLSPEPDVGPVNVASRDRTRERPSTIEIEEFASAAPALVDETAVGPVGPVMLAVRGAETRPRTSEVPEPSVLVESAAAEPEPEPTPSDDLLDAAITARRPWAPVGAHLKLLLAFEQRAARGR